MIEYIVNKVIDTREEAMEITRRHLAAAGALALGTASLLRSASSSAESADQAAVDTAVEALRKALLEKNKTGLEQLTADQLSYGHSSGKVQSKAEFVDGVMTSKAVTKSIAFPELTVAVVGDTAIARHLFEAENGNRRQDQQRQDRCAAGVAKAGRKLEAACPTRFQTGLIKPALRRVQARKP